MKPCSKCGVFDEDTYQARVVSVVINSHVDGNIFPRTLVADRVLCETCRSALIATIVAWFADDPSLAKALSPHGRRLIPVAELIAAIDRIATRPRSPDIERDVGRLEAVASAIDAFGAMPEKASPPNAAERIRKVAASNSSNTCSPIVNDSFWGV